MQDIKHILFVPYSPEQAINALILARKLSKAATSFGISNSVAQSSDNLDVSQADTIVIVGQKLPQSEQLKGKAVTVVHLNAAQQDAETVLKQALEHTTSADEITETSTGATRFVAITACPTGVAHTFMAAEALQQGAAKLGYHIDVETQGSVGAKNILSAESIANADIVILATDIEVNTDRFVGKRVYRCGTGFALKQT
ncbi:MAG: fructose PTS transporter subunit IIB, partial [Acinetobacter sp.]